MKTNALMIALGLFSSSLFAQTFFVDNDAMKVDDYKTNLASQKSSFEDFPVEGTWQVDGRTVDEIFSFQVQVGKFADLENFGSAIKGLAFYFPANQEGKKYRGGFFLPRKNPVELHLFFFGSKGQSYFVPMKWTGTEFLAEFGYGAVERTTMVKVSDVQPFKFKPALMSANAKPRDIDGTLFFPSPQSAVTDAGLASTDADGTVLLNYALMHRTSVPNGLTGQGGVGLFDDYLTNFDKMFLPGIIFSTLTDTHKPINDFSWVKSTALVSMNPFVFRFDGDEKGMHMTVSEKEGPK